MPCFNNLVLFDPLKRVESVDTVMGELAEKWSWQDNYRNLVFFLRPDVKWHDGRPFTARDVTFTFDLLREPPETSKLRLNPRRDWYVNLQAVEAIDPRTVVFRLKRPQPSLLLILASGFTPIYAAHLPPASYRTGCVGTGPFKVKEWRRGEFVEYVKNPEYFVKGRPYLDGLRYQVIRERGTAAAALQTRRVDVTFPGDTTKPQAEQLKAAVPGLSITPVGTAVVDHLLLNTIRPPFDNWKVRMAVNRAIDRRALIDAVYQGGAATGAVMAPRPHGVWGLLDGDLRTLPGLGAAPDEKCRTTRSMAGGVCRTSGWTPRSRRAGENRDHLGQRRRGPRLQLSRRQAADRVGDDRERIVRTAADRRLRPRAGDELVGADDGRRYAPPVQLDPVVQTARGAGPSIPDRSHHGVALPREPVEHGGLGGAAGARLAHHDDVAQAVARRELRAHEVEQVVAVDLPVVQ
jgi:hypothetical protein